MDSKQDRGLEDHFAIVGLCWQRSKERRWNEFQTGLRLRGPFRSRLSSPAIIETETLEPAPDKIEAQRTISQSSVFAGDDRKSDCGTSSRQDGGSEDHFAIAYLRRRPLKAWRRN
jgi:hypothetical protein